MLKQQEQATLDALSQLVPKMTSADMAALVMFAQASVKQNPRPRTPLTLIRGRRYGGR